MRRSNKARTGLTAVALLGLSMAAAVAAPTNYSLVTTIAVPTAGPTVNPNAGGIFTSFDISFFDPTTGLDYVADRSNAGVDIFSGSTLSYVGRAAGFAGQQATTSRSGADGVVVVPGSHTLFAGDGNSTLKIFNISNPAAPVLINSVSTGGSFRVDEMAYSPTANLVLVANNADSPAYGTLINATTGAIVHANIVIPNAAAGDGLEQPIWNPNTNSFFISVPAIAGSGAGGVAEIKVDGTVGRIYNFSTMGISACAPTGIALGASGNLMVGCGSAGTQTVLLNPAGTGSIVAKFSQVSGSDELYYDPSLNDYFVTGVNATNGRIFDVISDSTDSLLQSISLPNVNAHSISVDPLNGDVFVPLPGTVGAATDALCPSGCVAVFAQSVPEPGTLPILAVAIVGLVGYTARRRR